MAGMDTVRLAKSRRHLPARVPDGQAGEDRIGNFGENYGLTPLPDEMASADEGSFFTCANATPGTGIATAAAVSAFSGTNAFLVAHNISTGDGGRRAYLNHLRLILTTAPAGTVAMHFAAVRSRVSREPTAANARTVYEPVNAARAAGRESILEVFGWAAAAAMTVPAAEVSDKVVARWTIPTGLGIVGDQYLIKFGSAAGTGGAGPLTAVRATHPCDFLVYAPPIIIEPDDWVVIHRWWVTEATAPAFEFELGHRER